MQVRSVEAIVRALNDAKVQYLIVVGLAVNAHGFERATKDVDLVIGLDPDNITRGLKALVAVGYQLAIPVQPEEFADAKVRESWRRDKGMVVLRLWSDVHRRTPIDVFVYEPFDFAAEMQRCKWDQVAEGLLAPIVAYEALIELKRGAGRSQDLVDIEALEEIQKMREAGAA